MIHSQNMDALTETQNRSCPATSDHTNMLAWLLWQRIRRFEIQQVRPTVTNETTVPSSSEDPLCQIVSSDI